MRMHAGLYQQDRDTLDVSEPIAFYRAEAKDKQVRPAFHFESEIPAEVLLYRIAGLDAVPLQFVHNVLGRIVSK